MRLGQVFVDTGAWFALQVADDAHHVQAQEALTALLHQGTSLVTSNLVIGETYTLLRLTRGYREARAFLDIIARSSRLERLRITEEIETRAYEVLERYADHAFSFVDATSFALMRASRMRYAFAFDSHFRIAGFPRIPSDISL